MPIRTWPLRRRSNKSGKVLPDAEDHHAIQQEHGQLPHNARDEQVLKRYRLAQSRKLIRLYEQGRLPLREMRAMDRLGERQALDLTKPTH